MRTLTCLLLLLFALAAHAAEPGRESFDAGVAAYRSGDVAGALTAFEQARDAGYDTPQLRFNLGLCYYRLERYAESRAQFEALRSQPGYAGVADFHLALIAAREGNEGGARDLWRSLERGPDAALAQRASAALERLSAPESAPGATGYLLAGVGYDDNPVLLDESVQPAGGIGSAEADVFAVFTAPLGGTARAATVLHAGAWLKDYFEDNGADQRGLFVGLARETADRARRGSFGLDASASTLDGEDFLRIVSVDAMRGVALTAAGARYLAQLSRIDAAEPYGHLEGWRARLGASRAWRAGEGLLRLGYEFEANDRQDLADGNEFFSHSPLRHRFDLALERPTGRGSWRWTLRWRESRSRDPDRYTQGMAVVEQRRTESLLQAGVQWRRAFARDLYWLLEYQYSSNDATPDAFDYTRNAGLLGLEWTPVGK
jgi:tetratricopeptide (TPR) repeat protein